MSYMVRKLGSQPYADESAETLEQVIRNVQRAIDDERVNEVVLFNGSRWLGRWYRAFDGWRSER